MHAMKARREEPRPDEKTALPRDLLRHFEASRKENRRALKELARH
ncbi:MAG: hypothetical protein ACE5JQ_14710 [Candidatus Methylomirabilales bacterium]